MPTTVYISVVWQAIGGGIVFLLCAGLLIRNALKYWREIEKQRKIEGEQREAKEQADKRAQLQRRIDQLLPHPWPNAFRLMTQTRYCGTSATVLMEWIAGHVEFGKLTIPKLSIKGLELICEELGGPDSREQANMFKKFAPSVLDIPQDDTEK
jgi:hypothetical protein